MLLWDCPIIYNMQLPYRKPGKYSQIPKDNLITQAKLDNLKKDLAELKIKRPGAAREVSRLAELGDFSENVEYQLAKGRLRGINNAIMKIDFQINHAEIIKTTKNNSRIETGNTVVVETNGQEKTYLILGSSESDPLKNIISYSSPLGAALLGKKVGDEVEIKEKKYSILKVS